MKRAGHPAIGFGILATAGLLASAGPAPAAECSLETLRGQYLFAATGTLFPPAFGVSKPSTSHAAGYSVYYGNGTGKDWVTFTVDGQNVGVPSPIDTTYTLNSDCTGTRTVGNGLHFNIFVATDGSWLAQIATDPGFAESDVERRVGDSNSQ
jgi:hypothetical protein